jgi:opine dehydrogenase
MNKGMNMEQNQARSITVIGAGSSGHAVAGFLSLSGYTVRLWNRDEAAEVERWLDPIRERGGIEVKGKLEGFAPIQHVTTDLASAVEGSAAIIVNTTTDAYPDLARQLTPHLAGDQPVILMAAGTLGSLEFLQGLTAAGFTGDLLIGETPGTVFGSRANAPAVVEIAGQKKNVKLSTLPHGREAELAAVVPELELAAGGDVLSSGFNNTGAALHVVPMVLNAGWIEATGGDFLYYQEGVTPAVAAAMEQIDAERLAVAAAFGYQATGLQDYLVNALGAPAGTLHETVHGVAMYATMPAPNALDHRFLWEDALAAAVPLLALAEIAGVPAPMHQAMVTASAALLNRDLVAEGRTAQNLGLHGYTAEAMKEVVNEATALEGWRQRAGSVAAAV